MEFVCKQQIPAASSCSFSRSYFLLIFVHAGSLITLPILQVTDFSKYILPSRRIEDFFHLFLCLVQFFQPQAGGTRESEREGCSSSSPHSSSPSSSGSSIIQSQSSRMLLFGSVCSAGRQAAAAGNELLCCSMLFPVAMIASNS